MFPTLKAIVSAKIRLATSGDVIPIQEVERAFREGNRHQIWMFVLMGWRNWNRGLRCAAEGGHADLVHFCLERGARDLEGGAKMAIAGGHRDILQIFLDQRVRNRAEFLPFSVEYGPDAISMEMVRYCRDARNVPEAREAIYKAARTGNMNMLTFLLDVFRNITPNPYCLCYNAGCSGNDEVIQFVKRTAPDIPGIVTGLVVFGDIYLMAEVWEPAWDNFLRERDWDALFRTALMHRKRQMSLYCLRQLRRPVLNEQLLRRLAMSGFVDLFYRFLEEKNEQDDTVALQEACNQGDERMVRFLINRGADATNRDVAYYATIGRNPRVLELILRLGNRNWSRVAMGAIINEDIILLQRTLRHLPLKELSEMCMYSRSRKVYEITFLLRRELSIRNRPRDLQTHNLMHLSRRQQIDEEDILEDF